MQIHLSRITDCVIYIYIYIYEESSKIVKKYLNHIGHSLKRGTTRTNKFKERRIRKRGTAGRTGTILKNKKYVL